MPVDITTRGQLLEECYEAAGIDAHDLSDEAQHRRKGIDMHTQFCLEYIAHAGNHAKKSAMRRYANWNVRRARALLEVSDKPQFGFMIMVIVWLLQTAFSKAADRIWDWYQGTENAKAHAMLMAAEQERVGEMPPTTWHDEYGDN